MPFTKGAQNAHWESYTYWQDLTRLDKTWQDLTRLDKNRSLILPAWKSSISNEPSRLLQHRHPISGASRFISSVTNKRTTSNNPMLNQQAKPTTRRSVASVALAVTCVFRECHRMSRQETSKNWNLPGRKLPPLQTRQPAKRVEHCGWGDTQH